MSRILIVDDEPAILRLLQSILERGGYEVATASDAKSAQAQLQDAPIAALILDLGLPDRDGLELITAVRARASLPIIVVTARTDTTEKIAALDLGADDYVTKPFDGDELLARIRSAMRRYAAAGQAEAQLTFGPVHIDAPRREVHVRGKLVSLTPREFAVLHTLVEAQGRVLTHSGLLERVWGKAHVRDVEYLRVVIRALRQKIEIDPSAPELIRNEPAVGYRLYEG